MASTGTATSTSISVIPRSFRRGDMTRLLPACPPAAGHDDAAGRSGRLLRVEHRVVGPVALRRLVVRVARRAGRLPVSGGLAAVPERDDGARVVQRPAVPVLQEAYGVLELAVTVARPGLGARSERECCVDRRVAGRARRCPLV